MERNHETIEETFARLEREGLIERTGERPPQPVYRATDRARAIAPDVGDTETLAELLEKLGMEREWPLAITDTEEVLRHRWQGREVRALLSHRASLAFIAEVPRAIVGIERIPEEESELEGDGLALTFGERDGQTILTLRIYEQLFDGASSNEFELSS